MATITSSATPKPTTNRSNAVRQEAWTTIDVDGPRTFVYGPRFGRLYLLHPDQASDPLFIRTIGLRADCRACELSDPVQTIAVVASARSDRAPSPSKGAVKMLYRLFAASRHVIPFRVVASWLPALARWRRLRVPRTTHSAQIGEIVAAVEHRVPRGDCYPRALTTALLCLAAGNACTLVIGLLSPTRKMHAWCEVDGCLPYEPSPEHYLYQPLWTTRLNP